jgi:S1-C subfamily serine protease
MTISKRAAAGAAALIGVSMFALGSAIQTAGVSPATAFAQPPAVAQQEDNVVRVVQEVTPAVVSISRPGGFGSGVLISPDGVLLTNAHVVGTVGVVTVGLADGRRLQGQVLGRVPDLDVAVVRVAGRGYPAAALGNSDALQAGQAAIAIGNPLGLERSVTSGVVSAVNRSPRGFRLEGLVQTDAAINPGNSGGPLLDSQGRVIGINTAIIAETGVTGLGFAIPINVASNVADQLIRTGRVVRPYMGILLNDNSPAMARNFNLPVTTGAIVVRLEAGSPAAQAGLRVGDIVVEAQGSPVSHTGELLNVIRRMSPGQVATLVVIRERARRTINIRLGQMS